MDRGSPSPRWLPRWLPLLCGLLGACARPQAQPATQRLSEPLKTLELLQTAIRDQDWATARECFSRPIREANADAIGTESFYRTDYWTRTRTAQVLFGPLPLLPPTARFELVRQEDTSAEVRITYPDSPDKDMRLQRIGLVKEPDGAWRVAEVYGRTQGLAGEQPAP